MASKVPHKWYGQSAMSTQIPLCWPKSDWDPVLEELIIENGPQKLQNTVVLLSQVSVTHT